MLIQFDFPSAACAFCPATAKSRALSGGRKNSYSCRSKPQRFTCTSLVSQLTPKTRRDYDHSSLATFFRRSRASSLPTSKAFTTRARVSKTRCLGGQKKIKEAKVHQKERA